MGKIDHYRVLGIGRDVGLEEIKSAYRREALRWHPDRNPGDPEAEKRFKVVTEAYETLREPQTRRAHDAELHGTRMEAASAGYGGGRGCGWRRGGGRGRGCGGRSGIGCRRWTGASASSDLFVDISLDPAEAIGGCRKRIVLRTTSGRDVLELRLPPGLGTGDVVRVERFGRGNIQGFEEDLHLRIRIAPAV